MEEWLSKLLTFFIINKQKRRSARRKIRSFLYAQRVYKTARSVGKNLHVRGYTTVTKTTILGDNVSFNGMKISGGGG